MTPDEAAAMIQDILWSVMIAEDECVIAETPYWDDAADVGNTEPDEEQNWYGEIVVTPSLMSGDGLTFLDNLGIWAIAGFIAYSGQIGAAIAFVPLAKRFVLAFKQHSLGGIIKVLIDFAEVAEIDTYGASEAIENLSIVMPDDDDEHTLYIMMSDDVNPAVVGSPQIQVVRKLLAPEQVTPENVRWNADCNCLQQTADGGTTWVNNPAGDPRNGDGYRLPPRTTSDPRCDAAANMTAQLKKAVFIFEQEIAQFQLANQLLDVVLLFLPGVGWVLDAILAAVSILVTIGADAISSAFNDTQWGIVECILYCDISGNGTVTQAQFDQILDDMHTQCDTVVYDVLYTLLTLSLGVVGLSNAGATGYETGDCDSCACRWCRTYLGGDGLGDWIVPYDILGNAGGEYNSGLDQIDGTSINEQNNVWASAELLGALHITEISISFNYVNEGGEGSDTSSLNTFIDGVRTFTTYTGGTGSSSYTWTGDALASTSIGFLITAQVSVEITCIELKGFGTPPATGRDCS